MVFLYFVCKLLSNMRNQHITAVSSEVFCFWLMTWKYYLIHPLFIDVNIVFLRIFWPIHRFPCSSETTHLILLGLYNISGLFVIFKCPADLLGTCPGFSLMVTTHNSTALKENGMTEEIFICCSFWVKNFLYLDTRYKKAYVYTHNAYVPLFSTSDIHQSQCLDGC